MTFLKHLVFGLFCLSYAAAMASFAPLGCRNSEDIRVPLSVGTGPVSQLYGTDLAFAFGVAVGICICICIDIGIGIGIGIDVGIGI